MSKKNFILIYWVCACDVLETREQSHTSSFVVLYLSVGALCSYQCYARGGGGPRDEVGTLNVIAHPTWGILANFEHKCWPRDREV